MFALRQSSNKNVRDHNKKQNQVKFNVHRSKIELHHYSKNGHTQHILPIWLVALCPGFKAVDTLGWLFILIAISPLQSYPKYLKTTR